MYLFGIVRFYVSDQLIEISVLVLDQLIVLYPLLDSMMLILDSTFYDLLFFLFCHFLYLLVVAMTIVQGFQLLFPLFDISVSYHLRFLNFELQALHMLFYLFVLDLTQLFFVFVHYLLVYC